MRDLLSEDEDLFPVVRAADIPVDEVSSSGRWLVEDLWSARAVGILGGPPKSGKSWLALEMAVCVASGKPCLGLYPVLEKGPALVYLAEDSLHAVRERTEALADHHGVDLAALDLHVVTAPSMRLDLSRDQVRLLKTVRSLSPRLLVLDPLVRLHRLDENSAHDISGLLAYLRHLQRELDLSIILVHHAKKGGSSRNAGGQGLRGSSDIHAWSDSSLYLRRQGQEDDIAISIEHRSAPAPKAITVRLVASQDVKPHLEIVQTPSPSPEESLDDRVVRLLDHHSPRTRSALREALGVKNERLGHSLEALERAKRIRRTPHGWCSSDGGRTAVPRSPPGSARERNGQTPAGIIEINLPGETESGSAEAQPDKG